ncbi:glycogen/starch synthase (plasmid) [Streptomyces sp. NBC_00715]|uniref:glycogen synthase n=1 Tax=Streptomyces sp. NBC_00715 TaxID=2975811 RepID=UPI002F90E2E1
MKVLYITQEYAPFFVEGGLGLTSRALPAVLQQQFGIHHDLVLPYYPRLMEAHGLRSEEVSQLPRGTVHRLLNHGGPCEVFLIRADDRYDRPGIYRDEQYVEYPDAVERAAFFGRAVADWVHQDGSSYDLVHANDWQSGAALAHLRAQRTGGDSPVLLMNVHSAAYQGNLKTPLSASLALPREATGLLREYDGGCPSLLLAGLLSADAAVTCSPTYDRELPHQHAGLPFGRVWSSLSTAGVVSGVDPVVWDPAAQDRPSFSFDATTVDEGKQINKARLRQRLSLEENDVPLLGVCSRFVEEKGTDLLLDALIPAAAEGRLQLALVGPAATEFQRSIDSHARALPGRLVHVPQFDQDVAWLVYAGADFTLMPSRVEPCGLNQLIAMAYGTLPIVSPVGGLRDTVRDLRESPDDGSGFVIPLHTVASVWDTVRAALEWATTQPAQMTAARRRVMAQNWSWSRTAQEFNTLYKDWVLRRRPLGYPSTSKDVT